MTKKINNLAVLFECLQELRFQFPEHKDQIDRCAYDILQKFPACEKPNCGCCLTFEEFAAKVEEAAQKKIKSKTAIFN